MGIINIKGSHLDTPPFFQRVAVLGGFEKINAPIHKRNWMKKLFHSNKKASYRLGLVTLGVVDSRTKARKINLIGR